MHLVASSFLLMHLATSSFLLMHLATTSSFLLLVAINLVTRCTLLLVVMQWLLVPGGEIQKDHAWNSSSPVLASSSDAPCY